MNTPSPNVPEPPPSRVPNFSFSFIVPGYGAVCAGRWWRGVFWFVLSWLAWLGVWVLLLARGAPGDWLGMGLLAAVLVTAVMLWDCATYAPCRVGAKWFFGVGCGFGGLVVIVMLWGCRNYRVTTSPMSPTLRGKSEAVVVDHILTEKFSYLLSDPRRGDVIMYDATGLPGVPERAMFVSRVIGLPGETIEIRDGSVWVDGRKLGIEDGVPALDYVPVSANSRLPACLTTGKTYTISRHGYFVIGDNTRNYYDSRYRGELPRSRIIARVARILFPPSRAGRAGLR